ncbi:MAG: type II secretion system protein [Phycisphaera sp. TMED9]|nr:MAG: type II secretion system protein [Phycisphaera sp. TMED9]
MSATNNHRGMTLVEILTVIGIIVVLLAILLPGLGTVNRTGQQVTSESNLRQIFMLMTDYSTDNREFIVPSSFDYRQASYPGKIRKESPAGVEPLIGPTTDGNFPLGDFTNVGSWADILWTYTDLSSNGILIPFEANSNPDGYNYRFDAPDRVVFESDLSFKNILRSTVPMQKTVGGTEATPFGDGARTSEVGHPGYFAANDWFRISGPDSEWYSRPQIRFPARSVYMVDSLAGETISPDTEGWGDPGAGYQTQVDFRYIGDTALFLTLDGGIKAETAFVDIDEIEDRGYLIHGLDARPVDHDHSDP